MLLKLNVQASPVVAAKLFYSYSRKDERLKKRLDEHLSLLKREGFLAVWHDREIGPGQEWEGEISTHLESADLILLLVSASFVASSYCYDREMARALERHAAGETRVIPIILKPVAWQTAPFARLQALPRDGRPVVSRNDRDRAFAEIAEEIRSLLADLAPSFPGPSADSSAGWWAETWILALESIGQFDQTRAEALVAKLRELSGDPGIVLRAVDAVDSSADGSRFRVKLTLMSGEPAARAVAELQARGELAAHLDCVVTELVRTYGATVRGSAIAGQHREEDFDTSMSPSREWDPVQLTGLWIDPDRPLFLNFIVDKGTAEFAEAEFTLETKKLVEYFWAAATIADEDLWVNLSAYESNRMIPPVLAGTRLGRDLLVCDCTLKRFAASLMHPERQPGKTYWERVQAAIYHWHGDQRLPVECFQKVWLQPGQAVIYQKLFGEEGGELPKEDGTAFHVFRDLGIGQKDAGMLIADSHIQILCESDLLALAHQQIPAPEGLHALCVDLFKEIVLPVIEREVNCCENFAVNQQIYRAVILATAFTEAFADIPKIAEMLARGPGGFSQITYTGFRLLGPHAAADEGVVRNEPLTPAQDDNREFHALYMQLFRDGVFRRTRRESDRRSGRPIVRTYFSGGIDLRGTNARSEAMSVGPCAKPRRQWRF